MSCFDYEGKTSKNVRKKCRKYPKIPKEAYCYDERREGIIALGQAYTLGHIIGMKEGRMVI